MSQGKEGVRKESLLKFAEAIGRISEARGTLDDREGGLLESQRTLMGELPPALVEKRAHEAVAEALSMAGTKRYPKYESESRNDEIWHRLLSR